jgi:hypothetical protein
LKARGSLKVWLDKEMQRLAQPNGKRGVADAPMLSELMGPDSCC